MTLPAILLWLNSAIFVGYGIAFSLAPEAMSTLVTGAAPTTASGLIDMRSTYGGMSIGLGILLGLAARSATSHPLGLRGVVAVMVGMASSRLLGLLVDGDANAAMYLYLALEISVAALAIWALRRRVVAA